MCVGFNGGTNVGAEESSSNGSRIANGGKFDDLFDGDGDVDTVCFGFGLWKN
jgi:hypothetical protein